MTPPSRTELRHFRPHQYLAHAAEPQCAVYRLEEGWACRFRLLPDGRRQITALYLPGDYCEPQWAIGEPPVQSITALTNVRACLIACGSQERSDDGETCLDARLLRSMVANLNRQSEWIVSLGRKSAIERLSELFCDLFERMREAGLTYGDQCALPLTQMDIADLAGLTSVHVNRVLQDLRDRGLLELQSRWLRIPDLSALRDLASAILAPAQPRGEKAMAADMG